MKETKFFHCQIGYYIRSISRIIVALKTGHLTGHGKNRSMWRISLLYKFQSRDIATYIPGGKNGGICNVNNYQSFYDCSSRDTNTLAIYCIRIFFVQSSSWTDVKVKPREFGISIYAEHDFNASILN